MDEKTALIIGTSHSYASCSEDTGDDNLDKYLYENASKETEKIKDLLAARKRKRSNNVRIKHPDRWQDNLENHGYKVTTFARPGCTTEHQLDAFYHYMLDNPSYWDLIIIEGRDPEANVSYPTYIPTKNQDTKNIWNHWIDDDGDRIKKFNFTNSHSWDNIAISTTKWYKEYQGSHLHLVNTWAANSALCTLASKYATIVKWFTFGAITYPNDIQNKSEQLQNMLIGEYCIADTLPALQQTFSNDKDQPQLYKNLARIFDKTPSESDTRCECGHLNKVGHKMLWDLILEPALIKENVL